MPCTATLYVTAAITSVLCFTRPYRLIVAMFVRGCEQVHTLRLLTIKMFKYIFHNYLYMCKTSLWDLQECCSCCSLGLQFRSEGHHCEAHQYLSFQCRHVFLTCCKGEEWRAEIQGGWHAVRERPALNPTPPPKKGIINHVLAHKIHNLEILHFSLPRERILLGEESNTHQCTARETYWFQPKTINFLYTCSSNIPEKWSTLWVSRIKV